MSGERIALAFGGDSPEHEVSLVSAAFVAEQLGTAGYEVLLVGLDRQGVPRHGGKALLAGGLDRGEGTEILWPSHRQDRRLRAAADGSPLSEPIDVLFPIIHGRGGEDGALQAVAELAGIACVGAGVLGSALAMDKDRARRLLAADEIPVVRDAVFSGRAAADVTAVTGAAEELGWPVFVKPARAGSSVGISRVAREEEMPAAVEAALAHDTKIIVEQAIRAPREIELAVLGNEDAEVSGPGEIEPQGLFYDYRAKYEDQRSRLLIPAPLPAQMVRRLRHLALRAFRTLDLAGMARVDFLLSREDESLVLNEVNTLPGFTPISMYPRLWAAEGVEPPALMRRLVGCALEALPRGAAARR